MDGDPTSSSSSSSSFKPLKPVPLPRQRSLPQQQQQQQHQKPKPLPRTRIRPRPMVLEEREEQDSLLASIPDAPHLRNSHSSRNGEETLNKRGTINIFQLAAKLQDPFNDFDDQFVEQPKTPEKERRRDEGDAEGEANGIKRLSNISFSSPLNDLDEDTRKRISTVSSLSSTTSSSGGGNMASTSSSDSDHYQEPPPPRRLSEKKEEVVKRIQPEDPWTAAPMRSRNKQPTPSCPPVMTTFSTTPTPGEGGHEDFESHGGGGEGNKHQLWNPLFPTNDLFLDNKRVTFPTLSNTSERSESPTIGGGTFGRLSPRSRLSVASSTESTDSFRFTLKRNSSYKGSTGSIPSPKTKMHEYDDVAIEDGTVVFLENLENTLDLTNNNSSSTSGSGSLLSRNSVIAEFDPLLEATGTFSLPRGAKITEEDENGNEGHNSPQNRYEQIGDEDDGRSSRGSGITTSSSSSFSTATSNNNTQEMDESESSSNLQLLNAVENPEYSAANTVIDFKANFRKAAEEPKEEYESLSSNEDTPLPPLPKKPQSQTQSDSAEEPTQTSPPTGPSFFRRFSHKFRLNAIREEKESSSGSGGLIQCKKCGNEHPESQKCKFVPQYREFVVFSTNLCKAGSGLSRKDWIKRRVVLSKGSISFYNEKSEAISEIPLEKIAVISKKEPSSSVSSSSSSTQNLIFFELGFINYKSSSLVLAAADEVERTNWMSKYIEALTTSIPSLVRGSFDRGGWCFLRETVTSDWRPAWLILKDRELVYAYHGTEEYFDMDLRKARSIELGNKEEEHRCQFVENAEVLTLDLICRILYIQTESVKITREWEKVISAAAAKNGTNFEEMQLTSDNVPVIVDKCIDFLYAHGTLAEGIYRQSGSSSRITALLSEFQKNAWSVTISPKEFTAHDVAGTLKRFFRTLPEPLVTSELYPRWIHAQGMTDRKKKETEYMRLLEKLPPINYNILKKLICHLYAVHELHEKNLMPLINLAPIWGPTLMSVDNGSTGLSYESACGECEVIKELIEGYYTLFRVEEEEIVKERKMQDALENFRLGSLRRKHSGDIKIDIYMWERDESSAINVTITPHSTAQGIVTQLLMNSAIRNTENISLHEIVCNNGLERPLHPTEKLVEIVLRWSLWDLEDRRNNYFILKKNQLYPRLVQYAKEPHMVGSEVKIGDQKSKSYRKGILQFSQATLRFYKDSKATVEQSSWQIEDIVWYMGCESKRTAPTKWCFTFARKTYHLKRSKDEPYFGWVVGCSSEDELHRWLGALVVGEHPDGLYPSVIF